MVRALLGSTMKERTLNSTLNGMVERMDVTEIYSPPRVNIEAKEMGLTPGSSLDLTTTDENGQAWDFSIAAMREKARNKVKHD